MATYTNLDASVDAGDPITTTLMQGLKDNPTAITEGAAGAPRVKAQALENITFTPSAGGTVILDHTHATAKEGEEWTITFKCRIAGTYRLRTHWSLFDMASIGAYAYSSFSSSDAQDDATVKVQKSVNDGSSYSDIRSANISGDSDGTFVDSDDGGSNVDTANIKNFTYTDTVTFTTSDITNGARVRLNASSVDAGAVVSCNLAIGVNGGGLTPVGFHFCRII